MNKIFFLLLVMNIFSLILSKPAKYRNKVIANAHPDFCVCGLPVTTPKPDARVFNGTRVIGYDWEWTVGIYHKKKDDLICTGSLISDKTVLTAAHCVDNEDKNDLFVLAGFVYNWELMKNTTWGERNVSNYIKHPLYDHHKISVGFLYDIAIIELDQSFELGFNNSISLACLFNNTLPEPSTRDYFFAGYGLTLPYLTDTRTNETTTPIFNTEGLRQIRLNYDYSYCRTMQISETNFCLQNDQGSLCDGDSGGGVFAHDSDKRLALVGVHAMLQSMDFGKKYNYACYESAESVSVMLSHHLDFITQNGNPSCILNNL